MSIPYARRVDSYTADIDMPPAATLCECGDCSWKGAFSKLHNIESCSLTPGDPSPAGRCPKCEALAYVIRKPWMPQQ